MDPSQIPILISYIALIMLSSFFSACETAFLTANRVRLRTLAAAGNKKAENVLKITNEYDKYLSVLLIGNNIVNIVVATLSTIMFANIITSSGELSATVSTIVTTLLLLIFAEITPKMLASQVPEGFCMISYPLVRFFAFVLTPINAFFLGWRHLLKKIFKLKKDSYVSGDELLTYVETAESGGGITSQESELIRSAIEFDDLDVYDIMIPRVNVIAIEENEEFDEIWKKFHEHGYSRMPVYSKTIDSIIGILHEKDFFYLTKNKGVKIVDALKSNICVSKTMKISAALRLMQKKKIHMAVVVDEFGGTEGIITIEDIIEELVGEIWDEHDEVEELVKKIDDNTFSVLGSENVEDMFEKLGLDVREEFDSATVGGWITEQMGKIPVEGEKFDFLNLTVTVSKATDKRVDEIRINIKKEDSGE